MRRRLFNLGAAMSLALRAATAALWVRSLFANDLLQDVRQFEDGDRQCRDVLLLSSRRGVIRMSASRQTIYGRRLFYTTDASEFRWHPLPDDYPLPPHGTMLGFGALAQRSGGSMGVVTRAVALPHALVAAAAIALSWWLRRARFVRRAQRLGLCPICGYDLRASPGRCPECGTEAGNSLRT